MKPRVIAVCGKGGVGKTTVSAMLAKRLAEQPDHKALLIDADPAGGLALALGLSAKRSVNQVRQDLIAELKKEKSDRRSLAAGLDYLLFQALEERGRLAFLGIGRPEEEGCYCAVNTLLRESIELLAGNFDRVVIDAEAGLEQVNRQVMSSMDYLLLVSDGTRKGLAVAEALLNLARETKPQLPAGLLLNRVRSETETKELTARSGLPLIGELPEDDTIREYDASARSFFDLPPCPALQALTAALTREKIL